MILTAWATSSPAYPVYTPYACPSTTSDPSPSLPSRTSKRVRARCCCCGCQRALSGPGPRALALAGWQRLHHASERNPHFSLFSLFYMTFAFLTLAHVAVQHLTQLSLANNNIASLEGLETLTNLTVLDLRNNAVSEMGHVAPLSHIPWLRELSLEGAPRRAAFPT